MALSQGTGRVTRHRSIIPVPKADKELFAVTEFAKIQNQIDNLPISNIVKSRDDSDKNPDIICSLGERQVGIQVTELKFSEHANARSVARQITQRILKTIRQKSDQSEERILVHIVGKFAQSNCSIKLNSKEIENLADAILDGVKRGKSSTPFTEILSSSNGTSPAELHYLSLPDSLRDKIKCIWFEKVPEGVTCYCPQANNIFINPDFSSIVSSNTLLSSLIDDIYDKKNAGLSEMLLIWTGDPFLFSDAEQITEIMRARFKSTTFKWVYYFTFIGAKTFYSPNRRTYRIV